jgi:hypothetical protein
MRSVEAPSTASAGWVASPPRNPQSFNKAVGFLRRLLKRANHLLMLSDFSRGDIFRD